MSLRQKVVELEIELVKLASTIDMNVLSRLAPTSSNILDALDLAKDSEALWVEYMNRVREAVVKVGLPLNFETGWMALALLQKAALELENSN